MENKKADLFSILAVLFFMIIGGYIIFLAIKGSMDFSNNMKTPPEINSMYTDAEKFMIFVKESGKIATMQAYYELARDSRFAKDCAISEGYINLCGISEILDREFMNKINETLVKLIYSYGDDELKKINYSISIEDEIISFNADKIDLSADIKENIFPFKASYKFDPSFTINMIDMGMNNMTQVVTTSNNCFAQRGNEDILTCVKQLRDIDFAIKSKEDKILFDLVTKEKFFFTEGDKTSYDRIVIKFII